MISIKVTGVKNALLKFDPRLVRKAAVTALNRTATKARTTARRGITQGYTVKSRDVTKKFKITRAKPTNLKAKLTATGARIPLIKFQTRARKISARARKAGKPSVRVRVKKGGALKPVASAFAIGWRPGRYGIAKRVGRLRIPTRELTGPSVPQMFGSAEVHREVEKRIRDEFPKEFDHQLGWQMKRARK